MIHTVEPDKNRKAGWIVIIGNGNIYLGVANKIRGCAMHVRDALLTFPNKQSSDVPELTEVCVVDIQTFLNCRIRTIWVS